MSTGREAQVIDTFLTLTDTLVHGFEPLDMLATLAERCPELLDVSAAGVILTDAPGSPGLSVAAASSENTRLLEVFAVAIESGPCVDCVRSGRPVTCDDLTEPGPRHRWGRYALGATEAGFRATHAVPMRIRDDIVGVLTLLHTDRHTLVDPDLRLARALADAATIGLLHERSIRHVESVHEQLRGALKDRILIEQATGVLAQQGGVSPEEAVTVLRHYARERGLELASVCEGVIARTVDLTGIVRGGQA